MADKLQLEVITPERLALRETVDEVTLPGLGGELGILPEHTPLISQLQTGVLSYRKGGEKKLVHVSGGFAEVLPDRVSVLADVAETAEEIDAARAERARESAQRQLAGGEGDAIEAQRKLQRAITRLELAAQARK
ncbi:MAG: F0F1 ATP synthase subunit epsilon [Acidobacteria bacterium]|nr:F0F1 ATP synthase subunit epsilon [Acidobacteriota bacterium]MCW5968580.1 F0F1 ATP synthase subunit epsilon [Blastocatellales bacterium]